MGPPGTGVTFMCLFATQGRVSTRRSDYHCTIAGDPSGLPQGTFAWDLPRINQNPKTESLGVSERILNRANEISATGP